MPSTPKESTSKVEPWDGAAPYLKEQYALADKLFKSGAPLPYQGSTIAGQSNATKAALNSAEAIARNGDKAQVLGQARNSVQNVMGSKLDSGANQTLAQLQQQQNFGTNPVDRIAAQIGMGTPSAGQGYTNPALAGASALPGYTNSAVDQAAGLGGFTNAGITAMQQQAQQLATGQNPALDYLKATASGQNIGKNPYLDSMVATQQGKIADTLKNVIAPGIDSLTVAAGRFGSGSYARQRNSADQTAATQMAEVATNMYGNQYNADQQAQQAAASTYGNLANQDVANRMNANQALISSLNDQQSQRLSGTQLYGNLQDAQQSQRLSGTQLYGNLADAQQQQRQTALNSDRDYQMAGLGLQADSYQNRISNMLAGNAQRLDAANSKIAADSGINSQKLQAAGMADQVYMNQYLPSQQLAAVGQQRDARADAELQSKINAWDRQQQQPIQNISNFVNLLNGGGYSNTTTPVYTNTLGQAAGLASSLAGLFALSDERSKIIHRHLGFMPMTNGEVLPIYEWSYIDSEAIWVGPMAQAVEENNENAVIEQDGMKFIDMAAFIRSAA